MSVAELGADDFARRFSMRAPNMMWMLGAGASTAAGVPSAEDMCWEFKQQLFISQRRASPKAVADLSNPAVRAQLQAHVDASGKLPSAGDPGEYAALFEETYPAEADRRAYMDAKVGGARPSFGHLALATMMRAQQARLVWTTNFDPLVADACARVYGGTGALASVALEATDMASQCITEGRWPVEVKLHGDFRSRRLKNTPDELRHQDTRLRQLFVECAQRFGLVVVGYSGRDDSIMETLNATLEHDRPYPAGLFWLHRGDQPPLARVEDLLTRAAEKGVETALVRIANFDETLRDLMRLIDGADTRVLDEFATTRRRWSAAPSPAAGRAWPVVRLNALPVVTVPATCRRVVCEVGGHSEARAAVEAAGVDVLVARTKMGVLAFGSDSAVRAAFGPHRISAFDLYSIETKRLWWETGERGLLRDALTRALARRHGLDVVRRRSTDLLAPMDPRSATWAPLREVVGALEGTVSGYPELRWREGVATRLDWAADTLWLLVDPRIVFDGLTDLNKAATADFSRERTVKRYNRPLNDLITFWSGLLGGDDLSALGIGDGIDAVFRLGRTSAFSRRSAS